MDVVYLKLPQEVQVVNRKIYLKDVAEIYCEEDCLAKRIGDMILYTVKGDKNEKIVFSVMKIIRQVQKEVREYRLNRSERVILFWNIKCQKLTKK